MVITAFQVQVKVGRPQFFQETLLADTSMDFVLWIPSLTLSKADVRFAEREPTWSSYTTAEALPTTRRVELIDRKEFATAALDENEEAFVVHIAALTSTMTTIYPARKAQIASLNLEEVPDTVPAAYSDYADVYSKDSAAELPEHTGINNHAIDLEEGKQPSYGPTYSLGPVELETLKITSKPT